MKLNIFKFGGASIKDAAAIINVGEILRTYQGQALLIVVSAMGKTTNALEKVVKSHHKGDGQSAAFLEEVKKNHLTVMAELFEEGDEVYSEVNDAFVEIEWMLEDDPHESYDYMYDQMVSVGELLSSRIVSAYLNKQGQSCQWLDARDVIRTDNLYREAWIDWEVTQEQCDDVVKPMVGEKQFVLTQGFIGNTSENFTTTLGREGSDYTAAIFSFCLNAEGMTIWKDVEGVLTADPRLFNNVSKLERLSYREAIEMTYYGAKVIHPKTIKPLQNKNIPMYVKSFLNATGSGTYISDAVDDHYPPMITVEKNQVLLQISTRDFSFVAEHHLSALFSRIASHRLRVNMMQNTAISFVVCVSDVDDRVAKFTESIKEEFKVMIEENLELVSVRHFHEYMLGELLKGKIKLVEGRTPNTIQMVLKDIPLMTRKK